MMTTVFVLYHSYEVNEEENSKLIGIYTSELEAREAIKRLTLKKGFCDRPDDFVISTYELNKDHWVEGFSTMTTIEVRDVNNQWLTVSAECLWDGTYKICEQYSNDSLGEFKHEDIVECEEREGILYAVKRVANI